MKKKGIETLLSDIVESQAWFPRQDALTNLINDGAYTAAADGELDEEDMAWVAAAAGAQNGEKPALPKEDGR